MRKKRTFPSPGCPVIPISSERIRLDRLQHILFLLGMSVIVATTLLVGCATAPTAEVSPLPGGIRKLTYPEQHFSVNSPPGNWKVPVKKDPQAVVKWEDPATHSTMGVFAGEPIPLPEQTIAKMFLTGVEGIIQQQSSGKATLTVAEEKVVNFNGKRFYQVVANTTASPIEGVQVMGKFLLYIFKAKKFDYLLMLWAPLGAYEQNQIILEQMARSFTYIE